MWSDKLEKTGLCLETACDQHSLGSSEKSAVTRAFSRAAYTYDAHAFVQQHAAKVLLQHFTDQWLLSNTSLTLLDLGCGTGLMVPDLVNIAGSNGRVVASDLSDTMLEVAATRCSDTLSSQVQFQRLDAEALPFKERTFDGVYSNLMVQWCNLPKVLVGCRKVLKPQGVVALSTLMEGSLTELTTTWSYIDQAQHVNRFLSKPLLMKHAQALGYQCYFETHTLYYSSVKAILMALKGIGANWVQTSERIPLTKHKWQALQQIYESYRTDQGLPLSYQIAYLVYNGC